MDKLEKTLNEELRNNDCIENLVNAIDSQKSIYDAFVVDGKLVVVFNDELETNEVEKMQTMLKSMDGCGEVFSDEFELGYKENFKSLTLDLLTDNVSIGKFEQGGDVESEKHEHLSGIAYFVLFDDVQDEDEFQKLTENVLTKQEFEQAKYSDQIREFDFDIYIEAKSWNIIPAIYDQMEKEGKERGQIIGYDIVNQSNTHKRFTSDLPYDEDYENEDYEYAKGGEMEDYYDGQGDEGDGNTFEELRSQIVLGVMEDLRIPRETAQKVVDEKKEMLTDLIENHGETNIYLLVQKAQEGDDSYAKHIETRRRMRNDEDTYPKGFNEFARGGDIRTLYKQFNEEKPTILLIMIADDVVSDFMRDKFDKTIDWSKLSDSEKEKYNEHYKVNKTLFEKHLMSEFVKLYYTNDSIKQKCKGGSRKTIESIKSVMKGLAKKYPENKYAKGGEIKKISTTTQVKRNLRGSGAFTLELEMAVYVPSTTVADQIIAKTLFQKRIQEVEKYLSKLFGGYSSNAVEGGYVSQEKGLIKEDVAKVTAFGTEDAIKKNFKPLMRQISKWCESWGQESMGFEFEGDLYYVSKDAKFSKGGKIENKPVKPKFMKNAKK
jgi:hypothetical protein